MKPLSRLLPLLLIYVLLLTMSDLPETARTDGARYLWFAENLTNGSYSPADRINLWSGAGYPLVLTPLVSLGLPLVTARLRLRSCSGFFAVGRIRSLTSERWWF